MSRRNSTSATSLKEKKQPRGPYRLRVERPVWKEFCLQAKEFGTGPGELANAVLEEASKRPLHVLKSFLAGKKVRLAQEDLDYLIQASQEVFYLLTRHAWSEALATGLRALTAPAVEAFPVTRVSLVLGVAFARLDAAEAIELEALTNRSDSQLDEAVFVIDNAVTELEQLREDATSHALASHDVRISYTLCCAHAMRARILVEKCICQIDVHSFSEKYTHRDDLKPLWVMGLGERYYKLLKEFTPADALTNRRLLMTERKLVDKYADAAIKSFKQCANSSFMRTFAGKDTDLLFLATTEPWKEKFDKAVKATTALEDYQHINEQFEDKSRKLKPPKRSGP